MYRGVIVIALMAVIACQSAGCRQKPKTKKQADLEAVKAVHKGVIATAIAKDMDTVKQLHVAQSDDKNLLNLLKRHNKISISLAVFVLKSAPDASMQDFGLSYIQTIRNYTSQLNAITPIAEKPADVALFDHMKLNAVQTLDNINSLEDVQKDFVQYASANASAEKTLIENYRNQVKDTSLKTLSNAILATDEAFVKRLDDFSSAWQLTRQK